MAVSGDVARRAIEACSANLTTIGFKKRAGTVYTCPVTDDVVGFLGLNSAGNRPSGPFEINPVVGVRHQPLERVVAELSGRKPHSYVPPSISTPLGYLMPESRYQAWLFGDLESVEANSASLVAAVSDWGTPYIRGNDSLEKIVATLSTTKHPAGDPAMMRVAAGLALLGDSTQARRTVEKDLDDLRDRDDMAATYYRSFGEALLGSTYV